MSDPVMIQLVLNVPVLAVALGLLRLFIVLRDELRENTAAQREADSRTIGLLGDALGRSDPWGMRAPKETEDTHDGNTMPGVPAAPTKKRGKT